MVTTKYIAKQTLLVNSIYGSYQLVEGHEVPEYIFSTFRRYVKAIDVDEPETTTTIFVEEETKQPKNKKEN